MNVSSLNFLNLDSSVFGLLVLKNRFITVLAVGVVFVFIKLQILFVCVLLQFLTAWFRFAIWCQVCFLWGIYLGFEVQTEDLFNCTVLLFPVNFLCDRLTFLFLSQPLLMFSPLGLFLVCHFPLQFCQLHQTKQDNR